MSSSIIGGCHFYNFSTVESAGTTNRRTTLWRSPRAAVIPSFHLPMRSYEVKNRTFAEDIKSLRLITAIKTPYLPDGRFDLEAYDALVNLQIENGVEGVIVGGTTGEGQLMSWDEHIMLIGHTVNCFGGSIKVIGNTGSNSTREAIHATEQGFAVGMHAALHINPYYGKTSIEGLHGQHGFLETEVCINGERGGPYQIFQSFRGQYALSRLVGVTYHAGYSFVREVATISIAHI